MFSFLTTYLKMNFKTNCSKESLSLSLSLSLSISLSISLSYLLERESAIWVLVGFVPTFSSGFGVIRSDQIPASHLNSQFLSGFCLCHRCLLLRRWRLAFVSASHPSLVLSAAFLRVLPSLMHLCFWWFPCSINSLSSTSTVLFFPELGCFIFGLIRINKDDRFSSRKVEVFRSIEDDCIFILNRRSGGRLWVSIKIAPVEPFLRRFIFAVSEIPTLLLCITGSGKWSFILMCVCMVDGCLYTCRTMCPFLFNGFCLWT